MGAQVDPKTGAGHFLLAPAVAHLGTEAVEMRLQVHRPAHFAAGQQVLEREVVGVETAILVNGEHAIVALGQQLEFARFGGIERERLVHHHVLPGFQGCLGDRKMLRIGGGHHHQVDVRPSHERIDVGHHGHARPFGMDFVRLRACHGRQFEP